MTQMHSVKRLQYFLIVVLTVAIFAAGATTLTVDTPLGSFDIELLEEQAPQTTANFLNYVDDGDFDNSFFHRSVPGFIVQSGAFTFANGVPTAVPVDAPVANEFGLSNTRGTVAMAKLDGDPDSATSGWFVNLGDNSANLDNQNGGFTVFGQVVGSGMEVVDQIAALQIFNAGVPFGDLPLMNFAGGAIQAENIVFSDISVKPTGDTDLVIDASFTGAWFDPTHDGEGFLIEILDGGPFGVSGNVALAYWFTYDPEGNQAWMVAIVN